MLFSFGQIIHAIHDLDADVISIETSRSHGDLIKDFEDINYDLGIGLGVYDIIVHVFLLKKKLQQQLIDSYNKSTVLYSGLTLTVV